MWGQIVFSGINGATPGDSYPTWLGHITSAKGDPISTFVRLRCVTRDETAQNGFGATLKYSLPPLLGRIVSYQPPRIYEYHKALIRPHLAGRLSPLGMG